MFCTKCKKEIQGLFIYYIDGNELCQVCFIGYIDTDIPQIGCGGFIFTKDDLSLRRELNKATINQKYGIASQLAEEKE